MVGYSSESLYRRTYNLFERDDNDISDTLLNGSNC
jgi:hypothetical protein